ncbi:hypothetical protein BGZ97_006007, partial [Linnemannia gamsii]
MEATQTTIPTTTVIATSSSPLYDTKSGATGNGALHLPPSTTASTVKTEASIHDFDSYEKSGDNKLEGDLEQQDKVPINHTPT